MLRRRLTFRMLWLTLLGVAALLAVLPSFAWAWRYRQALRSSTLIASPATAAAALTLLEPLYVADPADTRLARHTAAALAALGRTAEARAVLQHHLQLVPAGQLTALALLELQEAEGDAAGVANLLEALHLRTDVVSAQISAAAQARDWPAVLRWWRRLVYVDSAAARQSIPLAAVAALIERAPTAAALTALAQQQLPAFTPQPVAASAPTTLPIGGWLRLDPASPTVTAIDAATQPLQVEVTADGVLLLQLIDLPAAGTYRVVLAGAAQSADPIELRLGTAAPPLLSATADGGAWQLETELELPSGPTVLALTISAPRGPAQLTLTAAGSIVQVQP